MTNFSVLMSVFIKESPKFLDECLFSINNQSLLPNEIVLVKDGKLTKKLDQLIDDWKKKFEINNIKLKKLQLDENVGLGRALNEGIKHCSYDWIARMDSDDICLKNRFRSVINFIEKGGKFDVVGSYISEFDSKSKKPLGVREVKLNHSDIVSDLRHRNPMNHVTVFFKKQSVIDVDGYKDFKSFEDYYLWARMIKSNKILINIPEIHVKVRAGFNMLARRRGFLYMKQEFLMQWFLLTNNLTNISMFLKNILIRCFGRLLPKPLLAIAYRLYRS